MEDRILIVDDEELICRLLAQRLKGEGYSCVTANNGREALTHFYKDTFSLIISDIKMPELDGIETTKEIYQQLGENRPYIIAMTANVSQDTERKCLTSKMNDYISKPINIAQLHDMIKKWLNC